MKYIGTTTTTTSEREREFWGHRDLDTCRALRVLTNRKVMLVVSTWRDISGSYEEKDSSCGVGYGVGVFSGQRGKFEGVLGN